jgi:hypothetical protein
MAGLLSINDGDMGAMALRGDPHAESPPARQGRAAAVTGPHRAFVDVIKR